MPDEINRVTIMTVGVWQYQYLDRLSGPERDLQNIRDIFFNDPDIAIFDQSKYSELVNPTSEQLRHAINTYVRGMGFDNDILLFYFSGHGVPIGGSDFAFCTTDTYYLTEEHTILPMTAVSFTEILRTLWIKKIYPVFIIDACFSGAAGGALITTINQLIRELKGEIQRIYASGYAIFCSAPNNEQIRDNPNGDGGLISTSLVRLAQGGSDAWDIRSQTIMLSDLFPVLHQRTETNDFGSAPILLLGSTLPDFSIFNNINYRPLEYRLQPHLVAVLRALWNNGFPRALRPREIADVTGLKGAYGNHTKLSYEPWDLVITQIGQRQLNERGILFMEGNLKVPRDIVKNETRNVYIEKPGTDLVGINDFNE